MQNITVKLTSPLRKFADGQSEVFVEAASVGDALQQLCAKYPNLKGRIMDERDEVRQFLNVYLDKKDIKEMGGLAATVSGNSVISIASPFSGG